MHAGGQEPGYAPGGDRAALAVCERVPIPVSVQEGAGASGHRDSEVEDADRDPRLLLAPSRGVRDRDDAEDEPGVLAGEVQGERRARMVRPRLEPHHHLGMRPPHREGTRQDVQESRSVPGWLQEGVCVIWL
jgi:hypothetical protein